MIRQNIISHFYPYFAEDGLTTKWDSICTDALKQVAEADNLRKYYDVLKTMHGNIHDSHMRLWNTFMIGPKVGGSVQTFSDDISVGFCGDTCYVDAISTKFEGQAEHGDVIIDVNGKPINVLIDEKLKLVSASTRATGLLNIQHQYL